MVGLKVKCFQAGTLAPEDVEARPYVAQVLRSLWSELH